MTSLISLDGMAIEASTTVRAALLGLAKSLLARGLRALAGGIAFLADFLEPPKKEKRLNVVLSSFPTPYQQQPPTVFLCADQAE